MKIKGLLKQGNQDIIQVPDETSHEEEKVYQEQRIKDVFGSWVGRI